MSPPSRALMSTFIASRFMSSARTSSPLIGAALYFGKRIATSGAHARARGAVGLAVAGLLDADLALGGAVHVEQAEAQALHAVRAAVVVDHREPRLPPAGRRHVHLARDGGYARDDLLRRVAVDLAEVDRAAV